MDIYQEAILKSIGIALKNFKKELKFDYTIEAKVLSFNENTKSYTVLYNGAELDIRARDGLVLVADDIVFIRVIQGNFSNKFIDCKKP